MDLAISCDSLSAVGPPCGLKIAEFNCNQPLRGSAPPPTLHPYISTCGVDKKLSKMAENLASCALWRG